VPFTHTPDWQQPEQLLGLHVVVGSHTPPPI
jgi:hypothetical protein